MREVHVKGLSELEKFIETLPTKLQKNIMRGAMRAGMKVVMPLVKSNLHSVSGLLAAGLKLSTKTKGQAVIATIKTTGPHSYIAKFVEYGTKAHFISVPESEKPINAKQSLRRGEIVRVSMRTINRRMLKIRGAFVGPVVLHPGSARKPFMRPALDQGAKPAVFAVAAYIQKRLTKEGIDTAGVLEMGDE